MKCEFGFCLNCEREISQKCPHCSSRKVNDQYTEVAIPMNNGSKMVVGVCVDCTDKVYKADKAALMDAVKQSWMNDHLKFKRPKDLIEKHQETVKDLAFQ